MSARRSQRGYVLLPVVMLVAILASVVFLLSRENASNLAVGSREAQANAASLVAEAGIQHAAWLVNRADCSNYASLTNEPFGDHSYTVVVTPTDGSPITLQSAATLASGASRTIQVNSIPVYSTTATQSLTLQPGPELEDTYIWDGAHKNTNFGVTQYVELNNASAERVILMRFDLSTIPVGASISSATLELYLEGGSAASNGIVDAHRVTQTWFEGEEDDNPPSTPGATYMDFDGTNAWANPGGDFDPTPVATTTIPNLTQGWHQWDVSALAVGASQSELAGNGVLLRASGGNVDKIKFTSSDGNAAEWPKLTVIYACECGQPCAAGIGAENIILSTASDADLGGLSFTDKDLADYQPATDTATLFFDGAPLGLTQDIDAVHLLANGHIVLSAINTVTLGGVTAENEDLIEYDPATDIGSLIFDGSALFTSGSTDISAVHVMDNGHLLLTNEYSATLGGLNFGPNDIIDYDPGTNTAKMILDGSAVGLAAWINAVHRLDNGHIVISSEAPATLGGLNFGTGDLVDYDPTIDSATLYFDSGLFSANEDIRSVHVGPGSSALASASGSKLLFVVTDAANPVADEVERQTLIESWGYVVTRISDEDSQANFDAAASVNALAYISGDALYNNVSVKLADTTIGVAFESYQLHDEFGMSPGSIALANLQSIKIPDTGHYITFPFGEANVGVVTANTQLSSVSSYAADTQLGLLASIPGYNGALATLDTGDLDHWGETVAGRRVKLPWGSTDWGFDFSTLTADGRIILRRSLEWVAGAGGDTIDIQITDGSDDAEQLTSSGEMEVTSSDLEIADNLAATGQPSDIVGIRFPNVSIPQGESITNAYIQFQVDELDSGAASLTIEGEAVDDAAQFSTAAYNITSRPRTSASVPWTPSEWTTVGDRGPDQRTDDLSPIIQEIVGRPGWTSGNSLSFIISGSGTRTAEAYEGDAAGAPELHIEYGGGGGGGGGPGYNEAYEPWSATNNDTWESADLAPFGVPANAVVEVAVINAKANTQLWGGVRTVGSTLDRRLQLHEAESGGVDVMVMTVQADAASRIEHYSDTPADVTFVLLGYWGSGKFVESWDFFNAGASNSWQDHALSSYGVSPGAVAEILVRNDTQNSEYQGGVRTNGSTAQRIFDIHEPEDGGKDMLTLLTNAGSDSGATIEVFAESDSSIDFYLTGHWSTPPGSYVEASVDLGSATSDSTWQTVDLSGYGVPANSVVQITMANRSTNSENRQGLRQFGSTADRWIDLHEAESGGEDLATIHVLTDSSSQIQWYHEDVSDSHRFYLMGWWVLP